MKKIIWADPKKQWDGFLLTRYWLDSQKLAGLPLTQKRQIDGKLEEIPTTLGDIYKRLTGQRLEIEDGVLEAEVITDTEKEVFAGPSFNHRMLSELIKLRNEGCDPFSAEWFFYDHDSCRDDPHESYTFFVVSNDKIVREGVSFSDYSGSGFDPSVFQTDNDSDSLWFNDGSWREARIRFWYQKFYSETRMGQLMLLRDDEPELYGTKISRDPEPLLLASVFKLVSKIYTLLWVLIILIGLILFRLWK